MLINTYQKFYNHILKAMTATEQGLWTLYLAGQLSAEEYATKIHEATKRFESRMNEFIETNINQSSERKKFKKQIEEFENIVNQNGK